MEWLIGTPLSISIKEIILRMVISAVLAMLIGYERERHGRYAGVKTQMVVAGSSCLLMIISIELPMIFGTLDANSVVRADPGRIASYAVAGMGFLGAGAIIQGRSRVQGLTTAACLWASNAIGLAVGAGLILPAVASTVGVLLTLIVLSPLTDRISRDTYIRVYLNFDSCGDRLREMEQLVSEFGVKLIYTGFNCSIEKNVSTYELTLRLKSRDDWSSLIATFRRLEGLTGLRWMEGYVP